MESSEGWKEKNYRELERPELRLAVLTGARLVPAGRCPLSPAGSGTMAAPMLLLALLLLPAGGVHRRHPGSD